MANICKRQPCFATNPACSGFGTYHKLNRLYIRMSYKVGNNWEIATPQSFGSSVVCPFFSSGLNSKRLHSIGY